MTTVGTYLIIVSVALLGALLGVVAIGIIIWGITTLISYLQVEKMIRKGKTASTSPPKPKLPPILEKNKIKNDGKTKELLKKITWDSVERGNITINQARETIEEIEKYF